MTTIPIFYTRWQSPLGGMRLAASPDGLMGAWFDGDRYGPRDPQTTGWQIDDDHPVLQTARLQLAEYFSGQRRVFDVPLDFRLGTVFQQLAWQTLGSIAFGERITYSELAHRMKQPQAARAAGAAIGRNPLSIIVPCHRVLGANGSLTGYAGGLDRKRHLLALEQPITLC